MRHSSRSTDWPCTSCPVSFIPAFGSTPSRWWTALWTIRGLHHGIDHALHLLIRLLEARACLSLRDPEQDEVCAQARCHTEASVVQVALGPADHARHVV